MKTTSRFIRFGVTSAAIVALNLGLASAQDCTKNKSAYCNAECCCVQDVGKVRFAKCHEACMKAACPEPCVTKKALGVIFPKYYVLGLVYAPPGCSSMSNWKCAPSSVDYFANNSSGTRVSVQSSFATNADVKVDTNIPLLGGIVTLGANIVGGYQNTETDSSSQTITKNQFLEISATGNGDGIDHDQDQFILLLNPAVATDAVEGCGPTTLNWSFGLSGSVGTPFIDKMPVEWLKNPSLMEPNVAKQYADLGFTASDYQAILQLDPFANGPAQLDTTRFVPTTYAFGYHAPAQAANCNDGICTCLPMKQGMTNQLQNDVQHQSQTQYSVGATEKGDFLGLFSITADQKFTWTTASTKDDMTSSTQSASATVTCPSPNYQGPIFMAIYWDTLFGSFLFVPTSLTAPGVMTLAQGTALSRSRTPLPYEPLTLSFGGKTYHTWTDDRGEFVFVRVASTPAVQIPSTGKLIIRGKQQTVSLTPAQKLQIRAR